MSATAKADLKAIRDYLFREAGADVARYVSRSIREGIRVFENAPGIGHFREDLVDPPFRVFTVFSYLIIYDLTVRPIDILRILHGHRDVESIMDDDLD